MTTSITLSTYSYRRNRFVFFNIDLVNMSTVFLREHMMIDACSCFLTLCVLPPGGYRRASAHCVHYPHL